MAAYVIADIEITDPVTYEEYRKLAPVSLAAHGGRFVVRGGQTEVLEGDWKPNRIVVLEFESAEKARKWWHSPEYEKPKSLRQSASLGSMIIVEGV